MYGGRRLYWCRVDVGKRGKGQYGGCGDGWMELLTFWDLNTICQYAYFFKSFLLGVFCQFERAKLRLQQPQMIASKHDFVESPSTVFPEHPSTTGARAAGGFSHCPI